MENKVNQILIRRRNKVFAKAGNNTSNRILCLHYDAECGSFRLYFFPKIV